MCIGFCMLIKREVLDHVGGLNEEVERIFFEDEDFCMRAQQVGYQCVVAAASYVYHAEHRTVKEMPEREALFRRNREWCRTKWGRRIRLAWPQFEPMVPGSDELRTWLKQLILWARHRTHVYAFCPMTDGLTGDALFRSVGLVPHADIHWHAIPRSMAPWAAMALILKRRKKPYDLIASPESGWARRMSRLRWLHGADVSLASDEEQLKNQWKQRSRSPLSF